MFLGIDLGTGSVKALLLDQDLNCVSEASRPYANDSPHPGWAEIDPQRWWSSTIEAVRACVGDRSEKIRSIGLSGQSHSLVLVDTQGVPVRPAILWYDRRATHEVDRLGKVDPQIRASLANPLVTGMAGVSLMWVARHEPEILQRASFALSAKDWLRFRLTGNVSAEATDASATLLYDFVKGAWATELMEALALPVRLLPAVREPTDNAGVLNPIAAKAFGLPAGLPVAAGAADAAAALLGLGVVQSGQGILQVGTGIQIMTILNQLVIDDAPSCNTFRAVDGHYYRMAAMQNGGIAFEWVKSAMNASQDELYKLAFEEADPKSGVVFLPYLSGERTPHLDPDATGAWLGLKVGVGRAEMARAAFEGIAFSVRDGWEALRTKATEIDLPLLLTGGGSTDPRWQQLLADTLEVPLRIGGTPGGAARGAALLGASVSGSPRGIQDLVNATSDGKIVDPRADPCLQERYLAFRSFYRCMGQRR